MDVDLHLILRLSTIAFFFLVSSCFLNKVPCNAPSPFTVESLKVKHYYPIPTDQSYLPWWSKFKDPQLTSLILAGLSDSPDLNIARERVEQANLKVYKDQATLWPSMTFNGYYLRERFPEFGLAPPPFNGRTFNIADVGLNFKYELDVWGKYRSLVSARINEACAAKADLAQSYLIISSAIAIQYFDLQANDMNLQLAKSLLNQRLQLFKIIFKRGQRGLESDVPIKTAQLNVEAAKIAVANYENMQAISKQRLAILIGKNPFNTTIAYKPFSYKNGYHILPKSIPANLLANRPDIMAARYLAEAAAKQINVARSYLFPNINLLGLFSYQSILDFSRLLRPGNQNNFIEGAIDLPIFDAGARKANLEIANHEYAIMVNQYNQTILKALEEVAGNLTNIKTIKSQISRQTTSVRSLATNEKLITSRYRHGIVDYEQVLIARGQLLEEKIQLTNLKLQHLQYVVNLYKSLGGYEQG